MIPSSSSDRPALATALQPGLQTVSNTQTAKKPVGNQLLPDRLKTEQVPQTPVMDPIPEDPALGNSIPLISATTDPDLPSIPSNVLSDPGHMLHMQGDAEPAADTGFSTSQGILVYVPMVRVPGDNVGATGGERIADTYVYCNPEGVPDSYYGAAGVQDDHGYNSTQSVSSLHGYGSSAGIPDPYGYYNIRSTSDSSGYRNTGSTPDFPGYYSTRNIHNGEDSIQASHGYCSIQSPSDSYGSPISESIRDLYGYYNTATASIPGSGYDTTQGISDFYGYYSPQDYVVPNQNVMPSQLTTL